MGARRVTMGSAHRATQALAALVVLTGGAYAAIAVALNAAIDSGELVDWIEPRVGAALNREVTVGEASFYILPRPGVRVREVRVGNLAGFEGPALANVDEMRLDVSLAALARGRLDVRRLRVDAPRVHLTIDQHGVSNFGDLVPQARDIDAALTDPRVAFPLHEVSISNGSLTFLDVPGGRALAIDGGRLSALVTTIGAAEGEDGAWTATTEIGADSLNVRADWLRDRIVRSAGPNAALTLRGDRSLDWIEVVDGVVEHLGDTLTLTGRVDSLGSATRMLDLRFRNAQMSPRSLAALLPEALRTTPAPRVEGALAVDLRVRGAAGTGNRPALLGAIRLADVGVRLPSGPLAEHIDGRITIGRDTIAFDSIRGTLAGGPFELAGTVERSARVVAFEGSADPDLDLVDHLELLPPGWALSGGAHLTLALDASAFDVDSVALEGSARVEGLRAEHERFGVPLYVPAGVVALDGRDAHWSDLIILLGEDRMSTTGRVRDLPTLLAREEVPPDIEATLTGSRLDLARVFPLAEVPLEYAYAHVAFAHVGGRRVGERAPAAVASAMGLSRPGPLPARGTIDLAFDTLHYHRYSLTHADARVLLSDSVLAVSEASFAIWDGEGSGSLRLGIGPSLDEPFALGLELRGVDAAHALGSLTPMGEAVIGSLDMTLELNGTLDRSLLPILGDLSGRARLTVSEGRVAGTAINRAVADFLAADDWQDVPFTRWVSDLVIAEGSVALRQSELVGDFARVRVAGFVGLDGSVDLSLALSIPPERLNAMSLRRTGIGQNVLEQLRSVRSPLDLGLRIAGSLEAPILEPDATVALLAFVGARLP